MVFNLLSAGIPIGRVDLDDGEPAGGSLEPFAAYEAAAGAFRREGDVLWRGRAPWVGRQLGLALRSRPEYSAPIAGEEEARQAADEARTLLALATEDGRQVPVAWIDVADASAQREPPFVLVYFREAPAGVRAEVSPRPNAGTGLSSQVD
jgi:hypothetical protein